MKKGIDYGYDDGLLWYMLKVTSPVAVVPKKLFIKTDETNNWLKAGWNPNDLVDLPKEGTPWSARSVTIYLMTHGKEI